ncbi:tetratricopeptide repeat protein [Naasia aerilata]|uniref:tetratricopeptide repeat protein n=1 Tax=Naasia aerilata TaxID=1162966 RepID=UPI002572FD1F|nr:tetratricopeptide repeat protein [Naasia aerilata]
MDVVEWEQRIADAWERFDELGDERFLALLAKLAPQGPEAAALYEQGSAFDSTGHEAEAVELYERALAAGLGEDRRRQAVIQLASSLRNLGRAADGAALLEAEQSAVSDELDDAVRAFLALCLVDAGREREAVGVALQALAAHLPRYARSVRAYAGELRGSGSDRI